MAVTLIYEAGLILKLNAALKLQVSIPFLYRSWVTTVNRLFCFEQEPFLILKFKLYLEANAAPVRLSHQKILLICFDWINLASISNTLFV